MSGRRICIALATLLFVTPGIAARLEPGIAVSIDPATRVTLVSGPHHGFKAALTLVRTDWWLTSKIGPNPDRDPVLMFTVDMLGWPILERASTASGEKLLLVVLDRQMSPVARTLGQERAAITLPRAIADRSRAANLTITIIGKTRSFSVIVPHAELAAFLDSYDAAGARASVPSATAPPPPISAPAVAAPARAQPLVALAAPSSGGKTGSAPSSAARSPAPASAVVGHSVPASAESADPTPTIASLGIRIAATPMGAIVLAVKVGSKAAALGITDGDFIKSVDGKSIIGLSTDEVVARIGSPTVKTLGCSVAGVVKLR